MESTQWSNIKILIIPVSYALIGITWFSLSEWILRFFLLKGYISYDIWAIQSFVFVGVSSAFIWYLYRSKSQLQDNENRYRNLIELSPDPIVVHKNGKLIYVNFAAVKLIGACSSKELLGRSILDFVHPNYIDDVKEWGRRIRESGKPSETLQEQLVKLDGETVNVEVRSIPTIFKGEIIIQNLFRDITEQKRAEEALADTEVKYRSLVEDSFVGVFIFRKGRFTYINPRFTEIFGYTEEELLDIDIANLLTSEASPFIEESMNDEPSPKTKRFHFQAKGITKDKFVIDLEGYARTIIVNGTPALIGTIQNVTERNNTQELVRKAEKLSIVGQLAAGVAHEIRNPLTVMKGFIQLISQQQYGSVDYCAIVLSELERINGIVSEFLMVAKPQTEQFKMHDLTELELIQNIVSLINAQAIVNNIQILMEFEPNIPLVLCDKNQLKQVFINILKNAIEASPNGGQIKVQLKKMDEHNVLVRFIDNGCGIPKEILSKLGEPFYTTKEKGTGLGMMVSYKIVEVHEGHISISSEKDKGTTVDVMLPIKNSYQDKELI